MPEKFRIINPEEREARKWGTRFCSIKVLYAPESNCEVPTTACEFIDETTKMVGPAIIEHDELINHMIDDAKRTCKRPSILKRLALWVRRL